MIDNAVAPWLRLVPAQNAAALVIVVNHIQITLRLRLRRRKPRVLKWSWTVARMKASRDSRASLSHATGDQRLEIPLIERQANLIRGHLAPLCAPPRPRGVRPPPTTLARPLS